MKKLQALFCALLVCTLLLSGLSFLGLGAKPPTPEWGSMISASTASLIYSSLPRRAMHAS